MAPPMKLDCATIALIAEAVAEGRVTRLPEGLRALPEALPTAPHQPIRPEACRCGQQVVRHPSLGVYDRQRGAR